LRGKPSQHPTGIEVYGLFGSISEPHKWRLSLLLRHQKANPQ